MPVAVEGECRAARNGGFADAHQCDCVTAGTNGQLIEKSLDVLTEMLRSRAGIGHQDLGNPGVGAASVQSTCQYVATTTARRRRATAPVRTTKDAACPHQGPSTCP